MQFHPPLTDDQGAIRHHAYFIAGRFTEAVPDIEILLRETQGIAIEGNPDVIRLTYDVLGIDEGRALKELSGLSAFSGDRRFFFLTVREFTLEGQNALLKLFEDPAQGSVFFLVAPSPRALLPTLRSRFFVVNHVSVGREVAAGGTSSAAAFMAMHAAERLAYVAEATKKKDKREAQELLASLEALLRERLRKEASPRAEALQALEIVEEAARLLSAPSASVKLILEFISLALPSVKNSPALI